MEGELHIRLLQCRLLGIDTTWDARNVYDSYWRMYINNCGGAGVILPGGRFSIPANRVVFIPAWVRFDCHNVRPIRHFYVHFDVVGLSDRIVRGIFSRPYALETRTDFAELTETLGEGSSEVPYLCRVKSLVYQYLSDLLARLPAAQAEEVARSLTATSRFAATLQYIDHHLAEPLTNDRLAKVSHLSESHFAHCFRDLMGQTPARFVLQRRIAAAARLLLFTTEPIDLICERTGFANRFHFSRNFRRLMGVTPAAYRKATRV